MIQAERVVLELPEGWSEYEHVVRLRLLQRQAHVQQRHIALITRHMPTRKAAQQVGVPVFASTQELEAHPNWKMSSALSPLDPQRPALGLPEPPPWRRQGDSLHLPSRVVQQTARPTLHRARQQRIQAEQAYRRPTPAWLRAIGYVLAGLLFVLILGGFALYVLPAATITVVPGQEAIGTSVRLTASPNQAEPDLAVGALPARPLENPNEGSGAIATTGREQKPVERAVGVAAFSNLGNLPVHIPAGTILTTSTGNPVNFRTTEPADLPGPAGSRVDVPIEAVEPGISGNVRANTISTVGGSLRFQIRVTNPEATGGGSSGLVPVVKQEDKDALLGRVYAQAQEGAYAGLQDELQPGEWLVGESVQTFIIAQFFDHFNDEQADELNLTLRVLAQGVAVDEELARTAALAALEEQVPERGKLVANSIAIYRNQEVTVTGRDVQFTVTANGNYVIPVDPDELRAAVAGLTPEQATDVIRRTWVLARPPEFYQDPAWMETLPVIPSRMQVRVEYATEAGAP